MDNDDGTLCVYTDAYGDSLAVHDLHDGQVSVSTYYHTRTKYPLEVRLAVDEFCRVLERSITAVLERDVGACATAASLTDVVLTAYSRPDRLTFVTESNSPPPGLGRRSVYLERDDINKFLTDLLRGIESL